MSAQAQAKAQPKSQPKEEKSSERFPLVMASTYYPRNPFEATVDLNFLMIPQAVFVDEEVIEFVLEWDNNLYKYMLNNPPPDQVIDYIIQKYVSIDTTFNLINDIRGRFGDVALTQRLANTEIGKLKRTLGNFGPHLDDAANWTVLKTIDSFFKKNKTLIRSALVRGYRHYIKTLSPPSARRPPNTNRLQLNSNAHTRRNLFSTQKKQQQQQQFSPGGAAARLPKIEEVTEANEKRGGKRKKKTKKKRRRKKNSKKKRGRRKKSKKNRRKKKKSRRKRR